eukprot:GEMP01023995.1.p1 GENE.GEMP01023995.1~~GEMP01023995.1.p1  ORF type:complete len:546 (+),score=91.22 GEMP01023995.1:159-1796(+)
MTVRVDSVPAHTFPQELLSFEPHDVTNAKSMRTYVRRDIYLQTPLLPLEEKLLKLFDEMCQHNDIWLPRSMRARALRYIHLTKGDVNKAVQCCLETMSWRASFFADAASDQNLIIREQLTEGITYICGRDSAMRPVLVFRVKEAMDRFATWRPEDTVLVIAFILEFMGRYMFLPGKVEKYCVLLDMTGVGLWALLRRDAPSKQVTEVLRQHYVKLLKYVYVVGLSSLTPMLWTTFTSVMLQGNHDQRKFKFIYDLKDLRKHFAATQLEKKYGGKRDDLTSYYPWTFVPGPFTAGYDGDPNYDSHPSVHKALVRETTIGHLWISEELNDIFTSGELRWSREAPAIFKQIGVENKPMVLKKGDRSPKKGEYRKQITRNGTAASSLEKSGDATFQSNKEGSESRLDNSPSSMISKTDALTESMSRKTSAPRKLTPPADHVASMETLVSRYNIAEPREADDISSVHALHLLAEKVDSHLDDRTEGSEQGALATINSTATSKPGKDAYASESSSAGVPAPATEKERQRDAEAMPSEKPRKKGGCCGKSQK